MIGQFPAAWPERPPLLHAASSLRLKFFRSAKQAGARRALAARSTPVATRS